MVLDLISVKQVTERYGYSGSYIRDLLARGVISGEKIAGVSLVDSVSVEAHQARMARLGNRKHGTWAYGRPRTDAPSAQSGSSHRMGGKRER